MRCLGCLLALTGCFAVTDLERFEAGAGGGGGSADETDDPLKPSSLRITLRGIGVHKDQLVEFRVVDSQNFVQSRGVAAPVEEGLVDGVSFGLPNAIPTQNRPYRLDLFADRNRSGDYSGIIEGAEDNDHSWRITPLEDFPADAFAHTANLIQVVFQHNTQFTDIDEWPGGHVPAQGTGGDVLVRFTAEYMAPFVGRMLQLRVMQSNEPFHCVGLYRFTHVPEGDFEARVSGVVEEGDTYHIDVYLDANGNGSYENPASADSPDRGWRFSREAALGAAAAQAIELDFDPESPPTTVDIGEP